MDGTKSFKRRLNPIAQAFSPSNSSASSEDVETLIKHLVSKEYFQAKEKLEPAATQGVTHEILDDELFDGLADISSSPSSSFIVPEANPAQQKAQEQQRKMERTVFWATREIFGRSIWKNVGNLTESTAQHFLKTQVEELPILEEIYESRALVDTVLQMHKCGVYNLDFATLRQDWPWLMEGQKDLASLLFEKSSTKVNPSEALREVSPGFGLAQPTATRISVRETSPSVPESLSEAFVANPQKAQSSAPTLTNRFDDAAFGYVATEPKLAISSQETTWDPRKANNYSVSLPYPTQRAILREVQSIVEKAFHGFTAKYLPEKLQEPEFEYPEAAELNTWVFMIEEAIRRPETYQHRLEAFNTLIDLSKKKDVFAPALKLHHIFTSRIQSSLEDLKRLLSDLSKLATTLETINEVAKMNRILQVTTELGTEIRNQFTRIQFPLKVTLSRIDSDRKRLDAEEASIVDRYRQKEKEIRTKYVLSSTQLKERLIQLATPTKSSLPQSSPILYNNPNDNQGDSWPSTFASGSSDAGYLDEVESQLPWDPASIDRIILEETVKAKDRSLKLKERVSTPRPPIIFHPDEICPTVAKTLKIPGPGLEGSRHIPTNTLAARKKIAEKVSVLAAVSKAVVVDGEKLIDLD